MTESSSLSEPRPNLGEEIANSVSHGVGLLAALIAGPLLVAHAAGNDKPLGAVGASVFVATIVVMYLASALYHSLPQGRGKRVFRVLEHCAIFVLIAGTYTPVTLVAIGRVWGWALFGLVWLLAGAGGGGLSAQDRGHNKVPLAAGRPLSGSGLDDRRRDSTALAQRAVRGPDVVAGRRHFVHGRHGVLCGQANPILSLCLALVRPCGNGLPLFCDVELGTKVVSHDESS